MTPMKKRLFPLFVLPATALLLAAGCASDKKVTASYLLPARKIANVRDVDVLAIEPVVRLSGNQAMEGDDRRIAGLARQMLSMELYRRGFYQVTDDLWGSLDGAAAMGSAIVQKGSRHGYSTLVTETDMAKATLHMEIELAYDIHQNRQKQTFELKTVPYTIHMPGEGGSTGMAPGKVPMTSGAGLLPTLTAAVPKINLPIPYSTADESATTVERVESAWEAWESGGKGRMHVSLVPKGASQPIYTRDIDLVIPQAFGLSAFPLLRAAATALAPAIDEVVQDISPTSKTYPLALNRDGDPRAVLLLEAGAWIDAAELLQSIPDNKKTSGDWENQGVAFHVIGEYQLASEAYEKALDMNPANEELRKKLADATKAAKARKEVRSSGAKANTDTSFRSTNK